MNFHNADEPDRKKRPLRTEAPSVHAFPSMDGVELRLTRYQGGSKGPVILSHCVGVSSLMYSTDTIQTNLLEYLFGKGFDVWLVDHRLSVLLPASHDQSTMDDLALKDYPAMLAKVRELSGAASVQVVAHGVGSSTLTMAMLAGMEGVRAAVCSQVSTHLVASKLSRIKGRLRLADLALGLGVKRVTSYVDSRSGLAAKAYNFFLNLTTPMPPAERCSSPVCHRVTSIFDRLYQHDQLSEATHENLHELFAHCNLSTMRQLSRVAGAGFLVDAQGKNVYLPHAGRLKVPITFIHGAENVSVFPESTEQTMEFLSRLNGAGYYRRHSVPRFGHMDCIIGRDAAARVYPLIEEGLEETAGR